MGDKLIHIHFFVSEYDWHVAEFDGEDVFFGYAILNGDQQNEEWGYVSFSELKKIKVHGWLEVNCDLYRKVQRVSEVERITRI